MTCAEAAVHYIWQMLRQSVCYVSGYATAVDSRVLSATYVNLSNHFYCKTISLPPF